MTLPDDRSRWLVLAIAVPGLVLVACLYWVVTALEGRDTARKFTGSIMGSGYSLTLAGALPVEAAAAHEAVLRELTRVDALMSTYRDDSDLSRLNHSVPGTWVDLAPETVRVLMAAREVGERSGGVYDITVGPLVNLWGFGVEHRPATTPSDAEIEEARKLVGWNLLEIRADPPSARRLNEGVFVDLSSIAAGFASDQAAGALEELGVKNYCIDVSGELRARGRNGRGLPWRIAIESPGGEQRIAQRVVSVSGMAVATSGDYRNYFEEAGVRYSHIIDPRTGYPVSHGLASVTVGHPSCTLADAWATALLAAGPDEGLALAEQENLAAFFIVRTRNGFDERQSTQFRVLIANGPQSR